MAETEKKKVYSLEECSKHRSEEDCWLIIHGKVYDVTRFLDEHPGGYDIVVAASGKDGTEDFEEIGHSTTAQEMLNDYYIGEFEGGDAHASTGAAKTSQKQSHADAEQGGGLFRALLPLLIVLIAVVLYYLKNNN